MQILHVVEFNRRARERWDEACRNWVPGKGGFPYVAFYVFFDGKGNERTTGYVASEGDCHCWRRTKWQAREALQRLYE